MEQTGVEIRDGRYSEYYPRISPAVTFYSTSGLCLDADALIEKVSPTRRRTTQRGRCEGGSHRATRRERAAEAAGNVGLM